MKNTITFLTFISLFLASSQSILADEAKETVQPVTDKIDGNRELAAKVTLAKGKVYYHENNEVRAKRVKKEPLNIYVSDILRTKKESQAFITLTDESKLVLDENSVIHFNGVKQITAEQGIVLFDIKKQGDLKGLKITTKTAVIGIKGTQFMIDTNSDSLKLYMKEGVVNVKAINEGTFEHHIKEKPSYKDYLKEMFTSFSEYKKKQQEEFVEFVKSIDVPKNKAISINGNKLEDIEIPDNVQEQFKLLDKMISFETNAEAETETESETKTEHELASDVEEDLEKNTKNDPFDDEIFKKMK